MTSLAVKLHKGSCQLGVRPLCYKKMKQIENEFLMLMMNNERGLQLMTNLHSHEKVINSQCLIAIADILRMVERGEKNPT